MNRLIFAIALAFALGVSVQTAKADCTSQAADKHLAGAAKTSFLKKCEKTEVSSAAKTQCESQAGDKKLHGAAKASFMKKCVADAAK